MLGKRFYLDFVQQHDRIDKEHWWESFFVFVDPLSLTFLSHPPKSRVRSTWLLQLVRIEATRWTSYQE